MGKYLIEINVGRGGGIDYCYECKQYGQVRFVGEVRHLGGDPKGEVKDRYRLCDECTNNEISQFEMAGAEVIDAREKDAPNPEQPSAT